VQYWAFVANPMVYRIQDAVRERPEDSWRILHYPVRRGDRAVIWKAKGRDEQRGIVALAEVVSDPIMLDDSANPYWREPTKAAGPERRVKVRYYRPPALPIWEPHPVLKELNVSRARGSSVLPLHPDDWQRIAALAGDWPAADAASPGSEAETPTAVLAGEDWTAREIQVAVDTYITVLKLYATGDAPTKSEWIRSAMLKLPGRSKKSVEYKLRNISAILDEEGLAWVPGWRPAENYQALLAEAVRRAVSVDDSPPHQPAIVDAKPAANLDAFEDAPAHQTRESQPRRLGARLASKIDYAGRDARNHELGRAGELWVVDLERARLEQSGRQDLAAKVEHVSVTQGDGLGFDIASFESDGTTLCIEVKTTALGREAPFFVSPAELAAGQDLRGYRLYRVHSWPKPKVFVLDGERLRAATLEPASFRCYP
jgi:hypothetical protein